MWPVVYGKPNWKAQTQLLKFTAISEENKSTCKFQTMGRRIHLCATLPGYLSLYFYSHTHSAEVLLCMLLL